MIIDSYLHRQSKGFGFWAPLCWHGDTPCSPSPLCFSLSLSLCSSLALTEGCWDAAVRGNTPFCLSALLPHTSDWWKSRGDIISFSALSLPPIPSLPLFLSLLLSEPQWRGLGFSFSYPACSPSTPAETKSTLQGLFQRGQPLITVFTTGSLCPFVRFCCYCNTHILGTFISTQWWWQCLYFRNINECKPRIGWESSSWK